MINRPSSPGDAYVKKMRKYAKILCEHAGGRDPSAAGATGAGTGTKKEPGKQTSPLEIIHLPGS